MRRRVRRKWRPPLLLVLGGALGAVLTLPLLGIWAKAPLTAAFGAATAMLIVVAAVLIATLVLGFLLWRLLLDPVTALADRALAVKAGRAGSEGALAHYGTRELGDLGQSILDMTAVLQNREATIRSFTDHVSHELKTPLTAILGAAELLATSEDLAEGDRRLAGTILTAGARMAAELAALRRVAAAREPLHHGQVRLDDLVAELRAAFPTLALHFEGGAVALPLNGAGMQIVLTQLLGNAAAHGAGRVTLRAEAGREGPVLTVADDGPGISDGNRAQIFAPFFTTRREAGGTGMGLTIARSLLEAHGASIRLNPGPGGAVFSVEF